MPRANRYIQPGCLYHLTHRCPDRKFLFRFGATRDRYREKLRVAQRFKVPLLDYSVTSNHNAPAGMMKLEGEFAHGPTASDDEGEPSGKTAITARWSTGEDPWNWFKRIDLKDTARPHRSGFVGAPGMAPDRSPSHHYCSTSAPCVRVDSRGPLQSGFVS